MRSNLFRSLMALAAASLFVSACAAPAARTPAAEPPAAEPTAAPEATAAPDAAAGYKVGLIMVGPYNDKGWSQAHFEALEYVVGKMPNVTFDYVDKVNSADRPNTKGSQVADDLIAKGAKLIIFNSDDFKDEALETAKKHPDITVIHASGDYAWKDGKNFKDQPNLGNTMGQMEYGKMIGGCAAALTTQTGAIGYLGPLINEETRRLVNSAYLGAKYCWETYRGQKAEDLKFKVTWIGFWFNIPGVTLDPTKVSDDFYNGGYDVVMSGIDTPEGAVQGKKAADAGKKVFYVHYDYDKGCELAPEICVGVPFFNWGPAYLDIITRVVAGTYVSEWTWFEPDWKDINNRDTSGLGFTMGDALGDNKAKVEEFIQGLGDGSISLYKGPLTFQDGSEWIKDGETATPSQIWYTPQLIKGIEGPSSAQ